MITMHSNNRFRVILFTILQLRQPNTTTLRATLSANSNNQASTTSSHRSTQIERFRIRQIRMCAWTRATFPVLLNFRLLNNPRSCMGNSTKKSFKKNRSSKPDLKESRLWDNKSLWHLNPLSNISTKNSNKTKKSNRESCSTKSTFRNYKKLKN